MSVSTFTFARTHSAVFVAENIRNQLRELVKAAGLDPTKLIDDWKTLGAAPRAWIEGGWLTGVTIEFYRPGGSRALHRWDFDIGYGGSGVDDDMWVDRDHIRRTIEKAGKPPSGCTYRVLLRTLNGRPDQPDMANASFLSTEGLVSRACGTAIATQDVMANLRYWKPA